MKTNRRKFLSMAIFGAVAGFAVVKGEAKASNSYNPLEKFRSPFKGYQAQQANSFAYKCSDERVRLITAENDEAARALQKRLEEMKPGSVITNGKQNPQGTAKAA